MTKSKQNTATPYSSSSSSSKSCSSGATAMTESSRPASDPYEGSRRFFCTRETLLATVREHGVAVLPGLLDAAEIERFREGAWSALAHLTAHTDAPIRQEDPSSWKSFQLLMPSHSMLQQQYSGHAPFLWDIRQNPKVVDTFATIWSCKPTDLLTSFDGWSFHFPPEQSGFGKFRKYWFHTDQSPLRSDFECIQAWATAYDVHEGDATLSIVPGSHLHHHKLCKMLDLDKQSPKIKADWYKVPDETIQAEFVDKLGLPRHHVVCPAGSMVFWDSRALHCGRESLPSRPRPTFRCVSYVSMQPKRLASDHTRKRRRAAFDDRRTTTHWSAKLKLFGKLPMCYTNEQRLALPRVDPFPDPVLTPLGRSLI